VIIPSSDHVAGAYLAKSTAGAQLATKLISYCLCQNMNTDTHNSSATPRVVVLHHAIHPERDSQFRAVAVSTKYLKAGQKMIRVQCTQCQMSLEKPLKCAKVMVKYPNDVADIHQCRVYLLV
jgi:hypothetical protein